MFAFLMGLKTVSPQRLHELVTAKGVTVIDVNSRDSFASGHVPGAVNLDPESYTERDLPSAKDAMLVFYCSNPMCRKAPNAAKRAKKMGYDNVRVMSAGISGWLSAALPVERP